MTRSNTGLSAYRIAEAIERAGLNPLPEGVPEKFSQYYALLERWNVKLNLTAIREPEEALRRHFVECAFCSQHLPTGIATLLDYGSGAGLPGIPIALCRPEIRVTLSESQGKKASFLREAVRALKINAEVYSGRVGDMAAGRSFDAVSLRAVDKMAEAVTSASGRVGRGGWLVVLATAGSVNFPEGFSTTEWSVPGSNRGVLAVARRA